MSKVALLREKPTWFRPNRTPITRALPFFRSYQGHYVHRVKSGALHPAHGDFEGHMHFHYWCGGIGSISKKKPGQLFAIPPEHAVFCATCEGRAIGAGMDGARIICGRTVIYSPRI